MHNNIIEAIIGAVVLGVAILFLIFAYNRGVAPSQYTRACYSARFDRIDGLNIGSDVKMSGVKIGTIKKIQIDPKSFLASLIFEIDAQLKLPKDSSCEIVSDGIMGGKYLALVPGGSDEILKSGDTIEYTQSSVSLEAMIGQLIFSQKDQKKNEKYPDFSKNKN